jgi:conjugal transfer pilus assembly protein TraD
MFNDRKSVMMHELDVQYTDSQNKRYVSLLWMVVAGALVLFSIPGGIIGFFLGKKEKYGYAATIGSIGFLVTSLILMNTDDGAVTSVLLYLKRFHVYFVKGEYLSIIGNYFAVSLPMLLVFSAAIVSGTVIAYYTGTQSHREISEKEARTRYRNGVPVKFWNVEKAQKDFNKIWERRDKEKEMLPQTVLGFNEQGDEVPITDEEASMQTMVIGTTGAGKTTTLKRFIESCARRGLPCIIVDGKGGKGDKNFPGEVEELAKMYNRKFEHFDINGEMSRKTYNPIRNGNTLSLKEKIIDTTDWSEQHYKANAERVLNLILDVLNDIEEETREMNREEKEEYFKSKRKRREENNSSIIIKKDLLTIHELLLEDNLRKAIGLIRDKDKRCELLGRLSRQKSDWYGGMEARLALLAEIRILKKLLVEDENGIDLKRAMKESSIVLFSLDSLQNRTTTEILGRLITKDLSVVISTLGKVNAYAIYDEHGAYIGADIEAQFGMARSMGLKIITSTQEITDYKKSKYGDIVLDKVLGNTNVKIIMCQNHPKNAKFLADAIGTEKRKTSIMTTDYVGRFKSLNTKDEDRFRVEPDDIKNGLKTGEAVVFVKSPQNRLEKKVKVIRTEILKKSEEVEGSG